MNNFFSLIILISLSWSISANAQNCSKDSAGEISFKEISMDCIQKYEKGIDAQVKINEERAKKLEELRKKKETSGEEIRRSELSYNLVLNLSSQESANQVLNNTYFYRTSTNLLGKFVVRSAIISKTECSLFLEAYTFTKNRILDVSTTVIIASESNAWNIDNISFNHSGKPDFALVREHGSCIFKRNGGTAFRFGKTKEEEQIQGNQVLFYASLFLFGLAVFIVVQTVFTDEERFKTETRLEDADEDEKKAAPNDIVLKYSRPFFKRYFSPIVQGMKYKKKIREKYKRKLASSGMNKFLTPEDFYAFKLFLIIGFPIAYLGGGKFLEMEIELMYVPFLVVGGFFYPDMWIKEKITKRKEEILLNMPFVMDMLALSVEAGLDFVGAIQKVIEKAPPSAITEEFETFLKETKVGASRAEALRALSWRVDSLPVSSFCATLIAADATGASNLSPILKALSAEIRQKRSADIEKKGAQAATKILFPMLFLILPAVVIIIAAPFVIGFISG